MAEAAIAEQGLIGDLQTFALVSTDGSIDPAAPASAETMVEPASPPGAVPVRAGTSAPTSR
jgi:hypothetical protein